MANLAMLAGRVALVTGASRGIGAEIAKALAHAGARVALAARSNDAIVRLAAELPNGAVARQLDVTDRAAVDRVVDEVASIEGRLDIVVNNAGLSVRDTISHGSDAWWEDAIRVNLTAPFFVCRAAMRHLREGGRVVNVGSVLSLTGAGDNAAYTAAKHGLLGLGRALADEVAARGITVNTVCPGWVDTGMAVGGFEVLARKQGIAVDEARKRALGNVPTGRILTPEEVAQVVVFLCRSEAQGIHGQAIRIDGGATSW